MIGELCDTGVFSAIKDWKMVMESIMATPRRESPTLELEQDLKEI